MFPSVAGCALAKGQGRGSATKARRCHPAAAPCPPGVPQAAGPTGAAAPPAPLPPTGQRFAIAPAGIKKTPLKTPASPYTKPHNWRVGGEVTQRIANP